jgi:hypothetical protein
VALALAELPPGTLPAAGAVTGVSERQATLLLGTVERALSVTHVVPAPPARVLRALGVVLQQAPYELQLRETLGAHPLDGGVIVFGLHGAVVGVMNASGGARAGNVNAYWMQTQQALEARQLQVTLRAVPGDPQRTGGDRDVRPAARGAPERARLAVARPARSGRHRLLHRGDPGQGRGRGAQHRRAGPGRAVGLATVGVSLAAYRWAYPGIVDKARREILGALEAVAAAVQSEDVFGTLLGPGRRQRLSEDGDGGTAALLTGI